VSTLVPEAPEAAAHHRPGKTVLQPRSGWQAIHLHELWDYRELLWILAMRDIKVRYKQTVLGAAWALLQPLLQTIVFVAFFSGMAPSDVNPKVFFFSGSLIYQLFATAITNSGNSLVGNQNLITKVYFPRLVIPIAAVITSLIDFAIGLVLLVAMLGYYHVMPGPIIVLFPVFVLLAFLASLGVGLWLSAMNVEFRDVRYVIPFMVQFMMFVTPVIYPVSFVHQRWKRILLSLNPMTGPVEGFRWCVLHTEVHWNIMLISIGMIVVLLVSGLFYFRRMEKNFADLV
jgi:lipopolysaccharide transport system permease protein